MSIGWSISSSHLPACCLKMQAILTASMDHPIAASSLAPVDVDTLQAIRMLCVNRWCTCRRVPTSVTPAHVADDAHVETGQAASSAVESPDANDTKAKKDKKSKKEKKEKKKRKEREGAEGDNEDDDLASVRSGKTGKKDKKDRKAKKAREET